MKRILPLLAAAMLGLVSVGLDVGCSSNSAYPFDDDDNARPCKTGYTGTTKTGCRPEETNEKDDPESKLAVDPGIVTLATKEDVACMTVDESAAFWIRRDGTIAAMTTTDVPSTGRPTIAESSVRVELGDGPCALVRDESYLWVTGFKEGVVRRLSIRKNADRTVSFGDGALTFSGFGTPASIAVDASSVYVAEYDGGVIRRFPKPPGDTTIADAGADASTDAAAPADAGTDAGAAGGTLALSGTRARHLVVDEDSVYWLSFTSAEGQTGVRRVAKTGGAVTTLALAGKDLRATDLHRIGGSLYFLGEDRIVNTVSVQGGLATPVGGAANGFTSDGTSLFTASGGQMSELGPTRKSTIFRYATEAAGDVALFAQPGRLVWTQGTDIATRVIR